MPSAFIDEYLNLYKVNLGRDTWDGDKGSALEGGGERAAAKIPHTFSLFLLHHNIS